MAKTPRIKLYTLNQQTFDLRRFIKPKLKLFYRLIGKTVKNEAKGELWIEYSMAIYRDGSYDILPGGLYGLAAVDKPIYMTFHTHPSDSDEVPSMGDIDFAERYPHKYMAIGFRRGNKYIIRVWEVDVDRMYMAQEVASQYDDWRDYNKAFLRVYPPVLEVEVDSG